MTNVHDFNRHGRLNHGGRLPESGPFFILSP